MFALRKGLWVVPVTVFVSCGSYELGSKLTLEEFCTMFEKKIVSSDDIYKFFPKSAAEVHSCADFAIKRAQRDLDILIAFSDEQRTFDNTPKALDCLQGKFSSIMSPISALEMVSPDAAIRTACHEAVIKLNTFAVDAFSNKNLYYAFKAYVEGNATTTQTLNEEQKYYLQETMRDFMRAGLDLPDAELEMVKKLKKELAELALNFEKNISTDKSSMTATKAELAGCSDAFLQGLKQDEQGNYTVGCDYPTYFEVREHCTVALTRKKLYFLFQNRACPQNVRLLEDIIAKRDELAKRLGFASYAALDIDDQMAQTVECAETFIQNLAAKAQKKASYEIEEFKNNLPAEISLDGQKRFNSWDLEYVKNCYKKKYFAIDERIIAEYFPVEKALQGVFDIYQKFLSLEFMLIKPTWVWHDDVQLIEIHEKASKKLRGYIFLDLYPRDDKFSHACHCDITQTVQKKNADGSVEKTPSVAIVIANFPKATKDRPALLKHADVETFFHEFGHAMHALLGSTEMVSFAGTNVKRDFVEMPSQIFEEWLFDKPLLKSVSGHYQTGAPLTDELIDKIIALKRFGSGLFVTRQCFYALLSLECYKEGAHKKTDEIVRDLAQTYMPYVRHESDTHVQASFGHLMGYGAKYYGYMWSKVFALDLFYMLKKQGLLNPVAGKIFIDKILAQGGSVDPNVLLIEYLGRAPNQDAFFDDLGLTE